MKHAKYIGPDVGWNVRAGETALILPGPTPNTVLAQFDSFYLARSGKALCFGWHEFPSEHFLYDECNETPTI